MKKLAAVLCSAAALVAAPIVVAPTADAEVCAGARGRYIGAGGCTNIGADVTGIVIASQHVPYVAGEVPCYTVEGVPYYTPPGQPC